jgi:hypothetical protein
LVSCDDDSQELHSSKYLDLQSEFAVALLPWPVTPINKIVAGLPVMNFSCSI